uniref:ELMO domain-containing protein n=1 Tax=Brassica oleracea var. oleracea TaxID=109376 RepID=A0A0D3BWP3_BRAOL
MDDRGGGSFVAVRRISQSLERGNVYDSSSSAEAVAGSAAWLHLLSCYPCCRYFQEECLQRLQNRMEVAYDTSIPQHQEALKGLWKLSFPEEELHAIVSEQWKEMGWQGKDPSTDFRGGGFISLENLLYFAKRFPKSFQDLLRKQVGDRSVWEYPFAVAGINITFMLIQMLGLETVKPPSIVGETFLRFLSVNESAFDILYCIAFKLMDHQWLSMRASYMEFNTVMKSTRRQLEREIMVEDITYIEDMPSYSLLLSQ